MALEVEAGDEVSPGEERETNPVQVLLRPHPNSGVFKRLPPKLAGPLQQ